VNYSSPEEPGRHRFEREGWQLKLPKTRPLLSDERLLQYGHPAEHRMLALALGLLAILLAAAVWFQERDLLLAVGTIYLSMLVLMDKAANESRS
jgi:hypothetical protein